TVEPGPQVQVDAELIAKRRNVSVGAVGSVHAHSIDQWLQQLQILLDLISGGLRAARSLPVAIRRIGDDRQRLVRENGRSTGHAHSAAAGAPTRSTLTTRTAGRADVATRAGG